MNIRYLLKSIKHFFPIQLKKDEYDIIFYYPSHFNRGNNNENAFFAPFYELCNRYGIKYAVFEEPELFKKTSRNPETVPFDFPFMTILILRKLIPLKSFDSFQHREWFIAKLLKPIFFRNFSFKNFIVLSQSMVDFFHGIDNRCKIFDYQHGVITSKHPAYIDITKQTPTQQIIYNEINIFVYGPGFKTVLINATNDSYYKNHTYVIGQHLKSHYSDHYNNNKIIFSLQFTDENMKLNNEMFLIIKSFFQKYENFFVKNNIELLLKHHPRFQNQIDVSVLGEFTFTNFYEGTLLNAFEKSFLHITFHSTTVFEASSLGLPSLLLKNDLLDPSFFLDDYKYPLGILDESQIIEKIEYYLNNKEAYLKDAKNVFSWYKKFYIPFKEDEFISALQLKGKT